MPFDIDGEMAERHELAEHRVPLVFGELDTDTESLDLVVAETLDALGRFAEQHVDEVRGAETLARPGHRRNCFLRRDQAVPYVLRPEAIIAIAARRMVALAEIAEQHLAPAFRRLAITEQRVELLTLDAALALGQPRILHEREQRDDVAHAVGHPGIGRQTVAARPAGFLVIGLERLRRVEMRDKAYIGLVDAHAEGDRRDDDEAFVPEKAGLISVA